jgi:RNA polymerase sigma-70 factor (ECF subfamily)
MSEPEDWRDDRDAFGRVLEQHRRDLVLLAYRFLGSVQDAEEAVQETSIRAWRGRASFRGEASVRTWLHRIATRVCLDLLRSQHGRALPSSIGGPADPTQPAPLRPPTEVAWIEPLPDTFVAGAEHDPAARYDLRESVSLAFIAALQSVPPRQRAVLLLRDVLGWSARETAEALELTVPAVNSALHRARTALRATHHRSGRDELEAAPPADPTIRRLFRAYVRAWESDDIGGLLATMRADVRLAMPPSPWWYAGRADVETLFRTWVFGPLRPAAGYRAVATVANGQPAMVFGSRETGSPPTGVQVLDVEGGAVRDITIFVEPAIAAAFGWPDRGDG